MSCPVLMLGTKLMLSARAENVLKLGSISPAPSVLFSDMSIIRDHELLSTERNVISLTS